MAENEPNIFRIKQIELDGVPYYILAEQIIEVDRTAVRKGVIAELINLERIPYNNDDQLYMYLKIVGEQKLYRIDVQHVQLYKLKKGDGVQFLFDTESNVIWRIRRIFVEGPRAATYLVTRPVEEKIVMLVPKEAPPIEENKPAPVEKAKEEVKQPDVPREQIEPVLTNKVPEPPPSTTTATAEETTEKKKKVKETKTPAGAPSIAKKVIRDAEEAAGKGKDEISQDGMDTGDAEKQPGGEGEETPEGRDE